MTHLSLRIAGRRREDDPPRRPRGRAWHAGVPAAAAVLLGPSVPALAHDPRAGAAVLTWADWSWHPTVLAGLALAALLYAWLQRRFPGRRRQSRYFWAGLLAVSVALLSPLDEGAAYLFTLHMVQHLLLMMVAAPLLALGTPVSLLGWLARRPMVGSLMKALWSPAVALALYAGNFVAWHHPAAYAATLRMERVHVIQHLMFVATGVVFWGVILAPEPKLVNASFAMRIVLLVAAWVANFFVSFVLAVAGRPLYAPYAAAPRLWGYSPVDDQTFGAGLMWVMGNMMYGGALVLILSALLRREERAGLPRARPRV